MEYIPLILQKYHVPTAAASPWSAGQAMLYLCAHTHTHIETCTNTHREINTVIWATLTRNKVL